MKKILAVLAMMLMLSPIHAAVYHFFNGERLAKAALEWEKSQSNPTDSNLNLVSNYEGYVGALFDHLSVSQQICTPDEMTKNQVLKIVADHVKTKHKGMKNSASIIVQEALVKAYTCKRWVDPK